MMRLFFLLFVLSQFALTQTFTYKAFNIAGATETQVRGVNSSGEIVGFYKTTSCVENHIQFPTCPVHGFKIVNGVLTKLLVPNSTWTAIMGVNDYGDHRKVGAGHGSFLSDAKIPQICERAEGCNSTNDADNYRKSESHGLLGPAFRWLFLGQGFLYSLSNTFFLKWFELLAALFLAQIFTILPLCNWVFVHQHGRFPLY
jgi:hypothetical protein